MGERCIYRERNAFRNYEPLVGNTNVVELRIFGPYHVPRSLECTGDGLVSKDEVCCSQLAISFVDVHLEAWNVWEMGLYPRMRCAALRGAVELGSAKSLKPEKKKKYFSNSKE